MLVKFGQFYDRISDLIGYISAGLMILMMINVFYDVINRYVFRSGSIALQEMEWHLFSVMFLLGISYALKEDGHVRVDLIYDNLSKKKQAIINIVGTVVFLIPFSLLIAFGSIDFVAESYNIGEISGDPGGLTQRWIIKAAIPFSFFLLAVSSIGFVIKNLNQYLSADVPDVSAKEGQA
jgi:TRAP-type mannitol/chloroaromatic compound transport system permease small subunit